MPSLQVAKEFPDGLFFVDRSFARKSMPKSLCVEADPSGNPIASRDVTIDEKLRIWARVFLPKGKNEKLPVVLYFHGGGFVSFTANTLEFHVLCESISKKLGALVISVNYRLAPENRLPAAYDDGFAALKWLAQEQGGRKDPWIAAHADLSKILVMGDSAGGNLAHHVAMRAAAEDLGELQIKGRVLIQPFFGGIVRLPSETNLQSPTSLLSTDMCDRFWELALPVGASRNHPYCRVFAPDLKAQLRELDLPSTLVVAGGLDVLRDRALEFVEVMRECGMDPELLLLEAADHAFYVAPGSREVAQFLDKLCSFARGIFVSS
ncbi:gibberellin receptor GID1C [Selaginella moellendorffii]|nr:gibberellin receptor GID1C [Selaginella moellendorffii]|eukprot:XP_002968441.2 gibberellin receptor GID1C [Selaginella moellendorffii]